LIQRERERERERELTEMGRRGIQIALDGEMVWDWTDGKDLAWARWTATLGSTTWW